MAIYNKNSIEISSRAAQSVRRDSIEEEIVKNASFETMWVDRTRNGTMDFGALQLSGLQTDYNFLRIGVISGSSTVGP